MIAKPLTSLPSADRRAVAALSAVLPAAASVEILTHAERSVVVGVGGRPLALQWLGRVGISQVRQVLEAPERPDIIVGSEISGAARRVAAEAGLGWVDETGAAEIVADGLVVSRLVASQHRPNRSLAWTPSVLGVAEALLCGIEPTVSAVTRATGHAPSATAHALKALVEMGLLSAEAKRGPRSGRRLTDENSLLDAYSAAVAQTPVREQLRCAVVWSDPLASIKRVGQRWDSAGYSWAATGALGAVVVAPYLSDVTNGEVYVDARGLPGLLDAARKADIEPMEGGRLLLKPFPTNAAVRLASEVGGVRVVSWPRLYADLRMVGVRGEEAAEHLRETAHAS